MRAFLHAALFAIGAHLTLASTSNPHPYSAESVISLLNLTANPEKGYYTQTYVDSANVPGTNRSYSTAIYYLLEGREGASYWHQVDATEIWHHYLGAPLRLDLSYNNGTPTEHQILGKELFAGQRPQVVIEKGRFQRAQSLGNWTLVGTTVAPAFVESGYVIEPAGWEPDGGSS